MKKQLPFIVLSLFVSIFLNAQLKVASSGSVGIGLTTTAIPLSALSIGGVGGSSQVYIGNSSNNTILKVEKYPLQDQECHFVGLMPQYIQVIMPLLLILELKVKVMDQVQ